MFEEFFFQECSLPPKSFSTLKKFFGSLHSRNIIQTFNFLPSTYLRKFRPYLPTNLEKKSSKHMQIYDIKWILTKSVLNIPMQCSLPTAQNLSVQKLRYPPPLFCTTECSLG
eukprot:TRINITY_DN33007_c0_g1_i1.p3 TRINITY_DN33007_c0_g1~~TRINITY_DN33007_c0_g1_i1.p3  ORF type:complete len:112 (+),score=5.61 TRINITY_DN33007_c0_g1_i1:202-537(+)